jgi:hypothetical protein
MTANYFSTFVVTPLLGWMAAVSVVLVGYLILLEIRDFRKNRRMDARRRRLGLRHA